MIFDVSAITRLQTSLTAEWHESLPQATGQGFLRLVAENHQRNFELWHEEDIARRDDLGFERVYQAKRAIDRFNQQRNNFMEEMDKAVVAELHPASEDCPRNSETPGMMIDRLSILALKEYHMREEAERPDASDAHRATCAPKLARIMRQRADLADCLETLLAEVQAGLRTFSVYFQFKMYNDPALNPELYRKSATGSDMPPSA